MPERTTIEKVAQMQEEARRRAAADVGNPTRSRPVCHECGGVRFVTVAKNTSRPCSRCHTAM